MHLENLLPLIGLWPLVLLGMLGLGAFFFYGNARQLRERKRSEATMKRYWITELAYRARWRAKEWLIRTKTPRLTYQPTTAETEDESRPAAVPPRRRRRRAA